MYAVTRIGTTVKSFQNDVKSVTSGSNLGIEMPPLISLITVIPTVITRNATANPTDKPEVKLNESETIRKPFISSGAENHTTSPAFLELNNIKHCTVIVARYKVFRTTKIIFKKKKRNE